VHKAVSQNKQKQTGKQEGCVCVCVCVCVYMCVCTYIHTYIHTHLYKTLMKEIKDYVNGEKAHGCSRKIIIMVSVFPNIIYKSKSSKLFGG
jgi:ABC-type antimicrobial peptide transport system permease subunit